MVEVVEIAADIVAFLVKSALFLAILNDIGVFEVAGAVVVERAEIGIAVVVERIVTGVFVVVVDTLRVVVVDPIECGCVNLL